MVVSMAMKNEFAIPDDKPRSILITTTEAKHRRLRQYKAILDKTWGEFLVDFMLKMLDEMEKGGQKAVARFYYEQRKKAYEDRELKREMTEAEIEMETGKPVREVEPDVLK